ncbi:MAG: hypothetical protein AAFR04_03190 [Pseudomonadota bacterium]
MGDDRVIRRWLETYRAQHPGLLNKFAHAVTVPVVYGAVLALLTLVPYPDSLRVIPGIGWAGTFTLITVIATTFVSWRLALGLLAFTLVLLTLIVLHRSWAGDLPLWQVAIAFGAIAFVVQKIAQGLAGGGGALWRDIPNVLMGPLWLLAALYRLVGLRY